MKRVQQFLMIICLAWLFSGSQVGSALAASAAGVGITIQQPLIQLMVGTPSDLMVRTFPGVLPVSLEWKDNVSNETGFVIERSTNGGSFVQVGAVGAGATEYTDRTVSNDMLLKYRVYANGSTGKSDYSNEVEWVTLPNNPSNLEAQLDTIEWRVNLTWQGNNSNCSYQIQKTAQESNKTTIEVIKVPKGTNQYEDSKITPGSVYTYFVMAVSSAGQSSASNTVSINYLAPPSNVVVINFPGAKVLAVKWQDNTSNETKFVVEMAHSNQGGDFLMMCPPILPNFRIR